MIIRWTTQAATDLEQISDHLAEDNPQAALKIVGAVFSRIEKLTQFPHRGRNGRQNGTRELVLSPLPYIAVYRVKEEAVQILHISAWCAGLALAQLLVSTSPEGSLRSFPPRNA